MALYSYKWFSIVKKHIDEYDYASLLAGGAPKDEFDSEAREICRQRSSDRTAEELAALIAKVFSSSFSTAETSDTFLPMARAIKNEL